MDNKKESIVLSTTFLIGLTIVVKAIGFLKQAVISYTYGTSLDMDIYLIVSSFIDELGVMFFTSISINLVTVYDREKEKSGKRASDRVAANSLPSRGFMASMNRSQSVWARSTRVSMSRRAAFSRAGSDFPWSMSRE